MESSLPSEFDPLLVELADQPEHVREIFRYALVLMMVDDEKAQFVGKRGSDGRTWITARTVAGEEFEIVRPEISEETEQMLLKEIRQIVEEARSTNAEV